MKHSTLRSFVFLFVHQRNKERDNITNEPHPKVVLANGTITTASETRNPDLFFALRGGSNNFTIVTAFTVRVFPQDAVSSQRATYTSANQTESALDAIYDLFTNPQLTADMDMAYDFYYMYNQASGAFSLMGSEWYANPAVAEPEVFRAIRSVPSTTRTARSGSMANLTGTLQPPVLGTTRYVLLFLLLSSPYFGSLIHSPTRSTANVLTIDLSISATSLAR